MNVWVITFVDRCDFRVAGSAEKAKAIIAEYVADLADEVAKEIALEELELAFIEDSDWFGIAEICAAEKVEVEA